MSNERVFYRCSVCGNLVEKIVSGGGTMVCCGKDMEELHANTTDAAQEKHVPVITRNGDTVEVNVGSVDHPMLEEHYIGFIVLVQGDKTQRVDLKPGAKPHATFKAENGPVRAYEWCNIHGLWTSEG